MELPKKQVKLLNNIFFCANFFPIEITFPVLNLMFDKLFQNHFHSVDVQFHIFGMTHHGNLHWTIFGLDKGFSQYLIFSSVSRFPVENFDALTLKNSV